MLADAGLKPLEIIDNGINLQFRILRPAGDATTEKTTEKTNVSNVLTREKTREKTTKKTTTEKTGEKTTEKATTEKTGKKTTEKPLGNTAMSILHIVQEFPAFRQVKKTPSAR